MIRGPMRRRSTPPSRGFCPVRSVPGRSAAVQDLPGPEGKGTYTAGRQGGAIMRLLMVLAGTLCLYASTTRAADEEDQATVRKHADKYVTALLQRDKVTLQALVHERYEGRSLPGFPR